MNPLRIVGGLSLVMVLTGVVGCGKSDQSSSVPPPPAPVAVEKSVTPPPPLAPSESEKAASSLAETASKAQGLIEQAQALIKDQKYTDAVGLLNQVAGLKLTPEQQKLVDELKALAQKSVADTAAADAQKKAGEAVGGLLGK